MGLKICNLVLSPYLSLRLNLDARLPNCGKILLKLVSIEVLPSNMNWYFEGLRQV